MSTALRLSRLVAALLAALLAGCTRYGTAVYTVGPADAGNDGEAVVAAPRLDPRFGVEGRFRLDVAGSGDAAVALHVTAEGGIVALSSADCALVGITPGGQLDLAFAGGGAVARAAVPCEASALLVDGQGRYLVAGSSSPTSSGVVTATLPSGRSDNGFGDNAGAALLKTMAPTALALAPDGAVLVAGPSIVTGAKADVADVAVTRLLPSGRFDASFGGGLVALHAGGVEEPRALRGLAGGAVEILTAVLPFAGDDGAGHLALVHIDGNGAPESAGPRTLEGPPMLALSPGALTAARWEPSGRLLLGGSGLPRASPDSAPSARRAWFGDVSATGAQGAAPSVAFTVLDPKIANDSTLSAFVVEAPSGAIYAAGARLAPGRGREAIVLRFDAGGALDERFGNRGVHALGMDEPSTARSIALAPDGALLVGGAVGVGSAEALFVARLLLH